ncbi:hypothetical protein Pcinc_036896 [Petrolisthes cinctipes]|uniref:Uncharacterized protein n=1 Tax=Petrolisthes cinctipes TaxID=88211 RepID=A0AAE1BXN9_PETCI|nr:hypothetical protein Pcinc_036896 [Petrolisthes cinctipes]
MGLSGVEDEIASVEVGCGTVVWRVSCPIYTQQDLKVLLSSVTLFHFFPPDHLSLLAPPLLSSQLSLSPHPDTALSKHCPSTPSLPPSLPICDERMSDSLIGGRGEETGECCGQVRGQVG